MMRSRRRVLASMTHRAAVFGLVAVAACEQALGLQSSAGEQDAAGPFDATCVGSDVGIGMGGADATSPPDDGGTEPPDDGGSDVPDEEGAAPAEDGGGALADGTDGPDADGPDATTEAEGGPAGPQPNGGLPVPIAYWSLDAVDYRAPRQILERVGGFDGLFAAPADHVGVPGQVGEALRFVGTDQPRYHVAVPPRAVDPLELTTAGTISAWVRFDTLPSTQGAGMALVDKGGFSTDQSLLAGGILLPDGGHDDEFVFSIGGSSGQSTSGQYSDVNIETGAWYHVVATFRAYGVVCLYVNGAVQRPPCVAANGPRLTDVQPLQFGDRTYFGSEAFSGRLDEIAIWGTDLSVTQVQMLYQLGLSGTPLISR
ncbi:MAG: hypothetical protein JOZ69_01780 [Myxococcales bacterium]|nr:hypothetical protein [Myxococcales bacterium]